jgi:hypothetical protein
VGLEAFGREDSLNSSADDRLAFRELGLSIGMGMVERLPGLVERNELAFDKEHGLQAQINALKPYEALKEVIERFWLQPGSQESESWIAHRDINMVMLATSLSPDGFLSL